MSTATTFCRPCHTAALHVTNAARDVARVAHKASRYVDVPAKVQAELTAALANQDAMRANQRRVRAECDCEWSA